MKEIHKPCGRRHGSEALVDKCEARIEAKAADVERRLLNNQTLPYPEKIRDRMGANGIAPDKVAAEMKRDYPPPPAHLVRSQDGWTVWSVVQSYAQGLSWGPLA